MKSGGLVKSLGRAPVPEWEEVARAAWPGGSRGSVAAIAARSQLPVLLLSFVLLLGAVALRSPAVGLTAWALGALGEWLATPADTNLGRLLDLVGFRAQLRALLRSLLIAALVFVTVPSLWVGFGYVVAVLLIQATWTMQVIIATWLSRSAPPLRYLPGEKLQPEPFAAHARAYARAVGTPGFLVGAESAALVGAFLAAYSPSPATTMLILPAVLLTAAWLASSLALTRSVRSQQAGWGEQLAQEIQAQSPSFLVYVSLAARQSGYIVNQWLPALNALPENGVLVVREASQLVPLAATRHPVVYAPGQRDLERMLLPEIRAAFYLAYGERNGQLLRDPSLKHVMLLHGDSDKATSANAMARAFDEVWVAGAAAIQRYRAAGIELGEGRFVEIGRPQVAGLPVGPSGQQPPVVLYAPTFEGYYAQTAHSSLDTMGVEVVRRLLADGRTRVWFRPHPASGVSRPSMLVAIEQINELLRSTPGGHVVAADEGLTLPDCLAAADVLISDISSVATDYLFTERPVITCDPAGLSAADFVAAYPTQAASYLLRPDLADFDEVLDASLGTDPLRDARLQMKRYVLGAPTGGPQAAFAANVARITGS